MYKNKNVFYGMGKEIQKNLKNKKNKITKSIKNCQNRQTARHRKRIADSIELDAENIQSVNKSIVSNV